MRWRVQLGLCAAAWAIYDVAHIAAGLLVNVAGCVVGARVSQLVEARSFGLPRLRLRPAVAEAPA
jgi:hypothetical protein